MAWLGQAPLAWPTPLRASVPCLADHTGASISLGKERAAALGVPRTGGTPGEGCGASGLTPRRGRVCWWTLAADRPSRGGGGGGDCTSPDEAFLPGPTMRLATLGQDRSRAWGA